MSVGNALSRSLFVVGAKRTPFGTFGGALKSHTPTDLQVIAANAALQAAGLDPKNVDSVCVGNVLSSAAVDTPYIARHAALRIGEGVLKHHLAMSISPFPIPQLFYLKLSHFLVFSSPF